MKVITNSAQETINLGKQLGRYLKAGDILGLIGELGSGKTTLVKGIAQGLGVKDKEDVSSPSFVLIKEYLGRIPLFHLDLYRLDDIVDIERLGVEEYLFDEGVCAIEWAEKMKMLLDMTPEERANLGRKNREVILRDFTLDKHVEILLRIYKQVLQE